jgi:hypothetical protein
MPKRMDPHLPEEEFKSLSWRREGEQAASGVITGVAIVVLSWLTRE